MNLLVRHTWNAGTDTIRFNYSTNRFVFTEGGSVREASFTLSSSSSSDDLFQLTLSFRPSENVDPLEQKRTVRFRIGRGHFYVSQPFERQWTETKVFLYRLEFQDNPFPWRGERSGRIFYGFPEKTHPDYQTLLRLRNHAMKSTAEAWQKWFAFYKEEGFLKGKGPQEWVRRSMRCWKKYYDKDLFVFYEL